MFYMFSLLRLNCRYDIYDVEVTPKDHYIVPGEIINDPRYSFLTLDMYEMLFEGGRSIRYCTCISNLHHIQKCLFLIIHVHVYKST